MRTRTFCVQWYSRLIVKQLKEKYASKEIVFVVYQIVIQKLMKFFSSVHFKHLLWAHDEYANTLATLAFKINISNSLFNVQDWHSCIIRRLNQSFTVVMANSLKDFLMFNDELYYRGNGAYWMLVLRRGERTTASNSWTSMSQWWCQAIPVIT